jgi:threonine/homoserine/homoserine lactone efflux protein
MLASFVLTATLVELTPGPNMTWLAALGASRGRSAALWAAAGIAVGLSVAAVVSGLGLSALLTRVPAIFELLRWAGTLYLLYLAVDAWRDHAGTFAYAGATETSAFRQGLVGNMLNPKAYLFYAAMLPQFLSPELPLGRQIALLSGLYVTIATAIHAAVAVLAGTLAAVLKDSPHAATVRKGLALLIAAAAIWFFLSTRTPQ